MTETIENNSPRTPEEENDSNEKISEDQDEGESIGRPETEKVEISIESFSLYAGIIIGVLLIFVAIYMAGIKHNTRTATDNEIEKFINHWRKNYPSQDEKVWSIVEGQIKYYVKDNTDAPLLFVLVYDKGVKTVKLLATEISMSAVKLKHKTDICGDSDLINVDGSDSSLMKGLLQKYLSSIEKCKKLVIYDLDQLSPENAADLHSLLDADHPTVRSAVFVFTVKVPVNIEGNIYHNVMNILRSSWSTKLNEDILNPLFSRLVNFIRIVIEPDFDTY